MKKLILSYAGACLATVLLAGCASDEPVSYNTTTTTEEVATVHHPVTTTTEQTTVQH